MSKVPEKLDIFDWRLTNPFWSYSNDERIDNLRSDRYWKLIRFFVDMRMTRIRYAHMEYGRYGKSWDAAAILEGFRGDIGDLSKLETGRRGLRGFTQEKLAHELFDIVWSTVVLADKATNDCDIAERACAALVDFPPLHGELFDEVANDQNKPSHVIDYMLANVAEVNKLVSPPNKSYVLQSEDQGQRIMEHTTNLFRGAFFLADFYEIDLDSAVPVNNSELLTVVDGLIQKQELNTGI